MYTYNSVIVVTSIWRNIKIFRLKHIGAFAAGRKPVVAITRVVGQVVFFHPVSALNSVVRDSNVFFVLAYGEFVNFSVAASDADCHVILCLSVLFVLLSAASGDAKAQAQRRYCT